MLTHGDRKPRPATAAELRRIRALSALTDELLEALVPKSSCRWYLAGEDVDPETAEATGSAVGAVEGRLRVLFSSMEGKEMPVFVLEEGDLCELEQTGWAPPDATMLRIQSARASVCLLPLAAFHEAIANCSEAFFTLLTMYRKLVPALGAVAGGRLHDPRTRVRHALWRTSQQTGDWSVSYTHEELAQWAGTERPKVTDVLGRLRQEGTVEIERQPRRIKVIVPDRLTDE